jgi:phage gpG-like protein
MFARLDPSYIKALNELQKLYRKFPDMAGIEAVKFSKDRFIKKNWVDRTATNWEPRKPPPERYSAAQKKEANRGSLMVKSGRLKRSIRVTKVTRNSVTIGTDVPYAEIHNEGGVITQSIGIKAHSRTRKGRSHDVKSHSRKRRITIKERRYMGESALLLRWIERLVEREITSILK